MKEERRQIPAPPSDSVRLEPPIGRGTRAFLIFLVCCAVLVAGFAVSRIWSARREKGNVPPEETENGTASGDGSQSGATTVTPETEPIPSGATVIRSADLSGGELRNETSYSVDLTAVRSLITGGKRSFCADQPVVLILHTHAQEGYRADDAPPYFAGTVGDAVYSDNPAQSVLAAGEALAGELNRNGIPAIHCTAIHGEGGTLRGAYRAAAECIQAYLKQYPSIEYVIDLHRDGILDTDGACLRTASAEGKAQVMAVVGTDGNGTACPSWRSNLGLALRLFDRLNGESSGSCRAVSLRNASYNQEFAPHSLLLEIGSAGNSVSEAVETATRVGKALAYLIGSDVDR